jgi:hypothetical protein
LNDIKLIMLRTKDKFWLVSLFLGVAGLYTVVKNVRSCPEPASQAAQLHSNLHLPTLGVADLPGYTGWGRPASTLAGRFRIKQRDEVAVVHHNWTVTVTCDGCYKDGRPQWFFVRAYGPAILNGVVERLAGNTDEYQITIHPVLEGQYSVEVVLTYSYAMDPDSFPLAEGSPPSYEGYMLPMFPLTVHVTNRDSSVVAVSHDNTSPYCSIDQLTVTEQSLTKTPVWNRASWRVTSANADMSPGSKQSEHNDATPSVSLEGYALGRNSLGFTATYEFSNCRLLEQFVPSAVALSFPSICLKSWKPQVHIVLIGDSVLRLQKTWIEKQVLSTKDVKITYLELYGGALRCSRLSGPNVTAFVDDPVLRDTAQGPRIVIFNTGMHDIHRLCGQEWSDDRLLYLTKTESTASCTTMYRLAIRELASTVKKIPADAYIFQTTTAAWPKYGNFGVAWDPRYAQELPLDSAFVERFNDIAISEVQSLSQSGANRQARIHIVDAYWITLARPDNREISVKAEIGKKLSHPGLEVVAHMVRTWWQVAVQQTCSKQ